MRRLGSREVKPLDYDSLSQDEKNWLMAQTLSMAHGGLVKEGMRPTDEMVKTTIMVMDQDEHCPELKKLYRDLLIRL